jgi:hypothetical protein
MKKAAFFLCVAALCGLFSSCLNLSSPEPDLTDNEAKFANESLDKSFSIPRKDKTGSAVLDEENFISLLSTLKRPEEYQMSFYVTYRSGGAESRTSGKEYAKSGEVRIDRFDEDGHPWYSVLGTTEQTSLKYENQGTILHLSGARAFAPEKIASMPDLSSIVAAAGTVRVSEASYETTGLTNAARVEIFYEGTDIRDMLLISLNDNIILRCESYAGDEESPFYAFAVSSFKRNVDDNISFALNG